MVRCNAFIFVIASGAKQSRRPLILDCRVRHGKIGHVFLAMTEALDSYLILCMEYIKTILPSKAKSHR